MNTKTLQFSILLLALTANAYAQSVGVGLDSSSAKPLNLAIRKAQNTVAEPAAYEHDLDRQPRRLTQPGQSGVQETDVPVLLPYGAGFDSRQPKASSTGNRGTGSGGNGSGSGGSGGGGRGGR